MIIFVVAMVLDSSRSDQYVAIGIPNDDSLYFSESGCANGCQLIPIRLVRKNESTRPQIALEFQKKSGREFWIQTACFDSSFLPTGAATFPVSPNAIRVSANIQQASIRRLER